MDTNVILISIGALVAVLALYYYFYQKDKKNAVEQPAAVQAPVPAGTSAATQQLQLQAYERLVILADRIAIPNLISRNNQAGLSKTDMQVLLTQTIKQEFDHNLSQQIYVSAEAWDAVRNLKEQNTHLINQVASILPSEASGLDLNKKLLEFVMNQPQGSLHNLVQDAISSDAKKLMK